MAINQINTADYDYAMMLSVINLSYKTQADITITNYHLDTAPQVTAGSIFANNGAIFENTTLATPASYSGIANSTAFYLYYDESEGEFLFSSTAPTWSDAKQGWYNGNDRAFFSMYKDSGGTLYQNKGAMLSPVFVPPAGGLSALVIAASTDWSDSTEYLAGTVVTGASLYHSSVTDAGSSPLGGEAYNILRVNTGTSTSYGYTGSWRLLTRIYKPSTSALVPLGLFQRIA